MSQMANWQRVYRRRRTRRLTRKMIFHGAVRMLAISLLALSFLCYRIDLPTTEMWFTDRAQSAPVTITAGEWEVEAIPAVVSLSENRDRSEWFKIDHNTNRVKVWATINLADEGSVGDIEVDTIKLTVLGATFSGANMDSIHEVNNQLKVYYDAEPIYKHLREYEPRLSHGTTVDGIITGELVDGREFAGRDSVGIHRRGPTGSVAYYLEETVQIYQFGLAEMTASKPEHRLIGEMHFIDGPSVSAIDLETVYVVYQDNNIKPSQCYVQNERLIVSIPWSELATWLPGEEDSITLTIIGEGWDGEEWFSFTATNTLQLEPVVAIEEQLTVKITGPTTIEIPLEGETAASYRALVADQDGRPVAEEVLWNLAGAGDGVTLEQGVVTVTDQSQGGEFTLMAKLASDESVGTHITIELLEAAEPVPPIMPGQPVQEELEEEGAREEEGLREEDLRPEDPEDGPEDDGDDEEPGGGSGGSGHPPAEDDGDPEVDEPVDEDLLDPGVGEEPIIDDGSGEQEEDDPDAEAPHGEEPEDDAEDDTPEPEDETGQEQDPEDGQGEEPVAEDGSGGEEMGGPVEDDLGGDPADEPGGDQGDGVDDGSSEESAVGGDDPGEKGDQSQAIAKSGIGEPVPQETYTKPEQKDEQ